LQGGNVALWWNLRAALSVARATEKASQHFLETDMNRLTTTILTTMLAAGAQLAHADVALDSPPQIKVQFADLDLTRVEGAAALYRRLHSAAQSVCAPLANDLARLDRYKACIADAVSVAVAEVDKPALTMYYRTQINGSSPTLARIAQR